MSGPGLREFDQRYFVLLAFKILFLTNPFAQRGAQTHDPAIKSRVLHRLSSRGPPWAYLKRAFGNFSFRRNIPL